MPRPTTGSFVEPGSSSPSFVPPLRESRLAEALDQLARDARQREMANSDHALAALSGSDPILFPVASQVRPRVTAMLRRHETERARVQADPARQYMNDAGRLRQEQALRRQQEGELATLEAEVTTALEKITTALSEKLQTLRGNGVTDEEMNEVNALAARLHHLAPELGIGEVVEFLDQVGTGERSRGQLVALLPVLESAYRTPGSAWTGRDELRRLVAIGESLSDGGANASIVEARLERAQRLAGDVATFMYLARIDPTTLNATVTGDGDPDRPHGAYALLPELEPPLTSTAPEDRDDDAEPRPFRRVSVSAERRAQDAAAREAQAE
jgi:hypothetical protein